MCHLSRRPNRRRVARFWLCFLPLSLASFGPSHPSHSHRRLFTTSTALAQRELNKLSPQRPLLWNALSSVPIPTTDSSCVVLQQLSPWKSCPKRPRRETVSAEHFFFRLRRPRRNYLDQNEDDLRQQTNRTPDQKQPLSAKVLLGVLFSVGVVFALASGYNSSSTDSNSVLPVVDAATSAAADASEVLDRLEGLADNILDAALPMTASDAVSVTLGEGVAGIMGALLSTSLSTALRELTRLPPTPPSVDPQSKKSSGPARPTSSSIGVQTTSATPMELSDVVASGDYFLTRAAALPLLGATGLSPSAANVASVMVASIPYELLKLTQRRREFKQEADRKMQKLLEEQQARENRSKPFSFLAWPKAVTTVDPGSLQPVQSEVKIDYVEIFTDLTKWLEYAVLTEKLGGSLAWSGLTTFPYTESFVFGALANLSAQVYADILYGFSGFGGEQKQQEVLSRTLSEWSALYLSSCITGATLFGVYESSQIPAKFLLSALFSGGVEGCIGSNDYDLCVESFLYGNPPPGPTFEAQARAVFTAAASAMSHLGLDSYFFSS